MRPETVEMLELARKPEPWMTYLDNLALEYMKRWQQDWQKERYENAL